MVGGASLGTVAEPAGFAVVAQRGNLGASQCPPTLLFRDKRESPAALATRGNGTGGKALIGRWPSQGVVPRCGPSPLSRAQLQLCQGTGFS